MGEWIGKRNCVSNPVTLCCWRRRLQRYARRCQTRVKFNPQVTELLANRTDASASPHADAATCLACHLRRLLSLLSPELNVCAGATSYRRDKICTNSLRKQCVTIQTTCTLRSQRETRCNVQYSPKVVRDTDCHECGSRRTLPRMELKDRTNRFKDAFLA